jgi:hypothetical protein
VYSAETKEYHKIFSGRAVSCKNVVLTIPKLQKDL